MNAENRPASYPLRLEPEARAKLEALAKANGWSLNAQIVMMLDGLLQAEESTDNELERTIRRIVQEELDKRRP